MSKEVQEMIAHAVKIYRIRLIALVVVFLSAGGALVWLSTQEHVNVGVLVVLSFITVLSFIGIVAKGGMSVEK